MGIDWDRHLLIPLEKTFAERVNWRPRHGNGAYDISGIFDRAYLQDVIVAEGDDPRLNTTRPVLGVRDALFKVPPQQGDQLFLYRDRSLWVVSDVQPDSHGGSKLLLNRVRSS